MTNSNNKHQQNKNRYYYSTYSNEIYAQNEHNLEEIKERQDLAENANLATRNWAMNAIFNLRIIIIIASTVAFAFILAPRQDANVPDPIYQIGKVLVPADVNDIDALQIPEISFVVNKRKLFNEFLANVSSPQNARKFGDESKFFSTLRISSDSKKYNTVDSVLISLDEVNDPEVANRWFGAYLTYASDQAVDYFVKQAQRKLDDKKDELSVEINNIARKVELANQELVNQIKRHKNALTQAKNRGIVESISVNDLPIAERFGDLLYLQGSWKLEEKLEKYQRQLNTQVVSVTKEQEQLKQLLSLGINAQTVRAFAIESIPEVINLTPEAMKPMGWSVLGAFMGFFIGYIISLFLRRKTV